MKDDSSVSAPFSRRGFLAAGLSVSGLAAGVDPSQAAPASSAPGLAGVSTILKTDPRRLVSRADLTYETPVSRSEEGMPVGNGRMGSLVWTSPSALKFQINRVDVYPVSCTTNSFPVRHTDYASTCGAVDIDFVDFGEDVFAGPAFRQHLSVYDALMTAAGQGVTARVLAWHERDVMAVEIDDRRNTAGPINIDLRMLRYGVEYHQGQNWELTSKHTVMVRTRSHTAASRLDIRDGRIVLSQEFREGDHYDASAVVIGVVGRKAKAKYVSDSTVRLSAAPGQGRFTVLIASAASFDPKQDVAALALKELDAAAAKGFEGLLAANQSWWQEFWRRGFVHLTSADGVADYVEQHYTYFLYVMGSTSRGAYPPRFGGMLWFTNGDMRTWGAQHWWANTSHYYNGFEPANRLELMDPVFAMYSGMYDSCALAARQQWGSQGIWIPETVFFDGVEKLPDDIAAEMRELYLTRKPWEQRSLKFMELAATKNGQSSRWNFQANGKWVEGRYVSPDKGAGPFGHVSHIMATTAKIAFLFWLRYQYTNDQAWLRDRAYPMLRGAVEFYRNFPNLRKEADGKYHIYHVNNHEPVWDAQDTHEEMSAMHGITPVLLRASEILGVDADMRPVWREFLENLAPIPTNETVNQRKPDEPLVWVSAVPPARRGNAGRPSRSAHEGLSPAVNYDLCTLETENKELVSVANATYNIGEARALTETSHIGVLSRISMAAAHLGRAGDLKIILPNQIRCLNPKGDFVDWAGSGQSGVLRNRMTLREGPGANDCQRLGRAASGLHTALLQSVPPAPGQDPIIHLFGAWPKEWDAEFTLLARGAFLVTSAIRKGQVRFVELLSQAGGECRLRNPWGESGVTLYRDGKRSEELKGSLLAFQSRKGENIVVAPRGSSPDKL